MTKRKAPPPYLDVRKDGTIRMTSPLTGLASWYIPGRADRPKTNAPAPSARAAGTDLTQGAEEACDFCEANLLKTPPEKERMVAAGGGFKALPGARASALHESIAAFRRVSNLFEVVPYHYWVANYGFTLSPRDAARMEDYLSEDAGRAHVRALLEAKLEMAGRSKEAIANLDADERAELTAGLFGGSHDLIIARRHHPAGGGGQLPLGSGDLSRAEHAAYCGFTARATADLHEQNPHVRYVVAFQNWLHAGGASFDHLHKQLVGIDGWGVLLAREAELAAANPGIYNEAVINLASAHSLVLAENDHAILIVDIGHRHPTLAVYSKSARLRPWELSEAEMRGMSDLVGAAHRAQGAEVPSNEEWIYAPQGCRARIPWRVLIHQRVNIPSGFEGGTEIYIHPQSPFQMRDALRARLAALADADLPGFRVARDGTCAPDPLRA
ncbi:MAG: DUF4921 family protein [Myxococcota bacterium]